MRYQKERQMNDTRKIALRIKRAIKRRRNDEY